MLVYMKTKEKFCCIPRCIRTPLNKQEGTTAVCSKLARFAVMTVLQNEKLRDKKMDALPPGVQRVDVPRVPSGSLAVATD